MRDLLLSLAKERRPFIVYCLIGLTGVSLDYGIFLLLVNGLHVHYLVANAFSTTMGIVNNFAVNCRFNFKVRDRLMIRFLSFYGVGLAGLAMSSLLLYIGVTGLHLNPNATKAATLILVVVLQYNLNRFISFKP